MMKLLFFLLLIVFMMSCNSPSYRTFMWKGEKAGEHETNITLSDIHFHPELPKDYFNTPTDAQAITEM